MSRPPKRKEIHLHLNPEMTIYQVQAEYDLVSAGTEEEDTRLRTLAYEQVEAAIESYREEGWVLDGPIATNLRMHELLQIWRCNESHLSECPVATLSVCLCGTISDVPHSFQQRLP